MSGIYLYIYYIFIIFVLCDGMAQPKLISKHSMPVLLKTIPLSYKQVDSCRSLLSILVIEPWM